MKPKIAVATNTLNLKTSSQSQGIVISNWQVGKKQARIKQYQLDLDLVIVVVEVLPAEKTHPGTKMTLGISRRIGSGIACKGTDVKPDRRILCQS